MSRFRSDSARSPFVLKFSESGARWIGNCAESCACWNDRSKADNMNSPDGVSGSKGHELHLEPGYDYVKEIARGGYGYVYLFSRKQHDQQDFVAGKFVYRHIFGPADDSGSTAAYQRALEG